MHVNVNLRVNGTFRLHLPEKFFLSRSRHRSRDESRGTIGSITSDGGTGDELTLPHSHDRAVKKRLSARIRSRHSSRSPFRRNNRAQSIDDDSLPREEGHRKSPKVGRSKSGRTQWEGAVKRVFEFRAVVVRFARLMIKVFFVK